MQENSYAKKQLKRIAKNTVIFSLILIAGVTTLLLLYAPNLGNLFFKTGTFDSEFELARLLDANNVYVTHTTDEFFYSGYTLESDGVDEADFYLFNAGTQYVICRTKPGMTDESYANYEVRGRVEMPKGKDAELRGMLVREWLEYWQEEEPDLTRAEVMTWFAPYIIDTTAPRWQPQLLVLGAFALIIFALVKMLLAVRNASDITESKWYKRMTFNGTEDAALVNDAVTAELAGENWVAFNKNLCITENWIVSQTNFSFKVRRKSDLVWLYKTVTQHRTNGIPTGKTYAVTLRFTDKTTEAAGARNEAGTDNFMNILMSCCPDAVYGFSKELEQLYNKDLAGFINMAAENAQHRKETAAQAQAAEEAASNPVSETQTEADTNPETNLETNPDTDI